MTAFLLANLAPIMFASLIVFLLAGYSVAFSLAACGLFFGFVAIEALVFGSYFVAYMLYRVWNTEMFLQSQAQLSQNFGAVNTVILLLSSWLMARAVHAVRERRFDLAEKLVWMTLSCGLLFVAAASLLTLLFSFSVTRITDYNATYGSLGTIILLLTWIYLSAYALVFGAELNSEIEHQTAKDSTTGKPLPLGKRGAWAADNVAQDDQPDRKDAPSMAEATPEAPTVDKD